MLGWFATKCPLDTQEKAWTELRMRWLADQFGIERLLRAPVVLPTEEFFPDPYEGTAADAQRILDRLCRYMAINPHRLQLDVCMNEQLPGAAGHYEPGERPIIRVAEAQLADPHRLVATLAHELAHELLLGSGRLSAEVEDHEMVTDLLPVFLGVGVFAANATVQETQRRYGEWYLWSLGRQGYLPARVFGYAFALFAFMRDEVEPEWASFLRLDASTVLRQGLRYLDESDDSLFHPDTIRERRRPPTASEAVERLETGSPTVRLATLWDLRDQARPHPDVIEAVMRCLTDRDPAIPGEAARTLAALGASAETTLPPLLKALHASSADTRAGAAHALGALRTQPGTVIPELCALLEDGSKIVLSAAALALRQFGTQAELAVRRLLAELTGALIECDHALIEILASTLLAITADPKQHLRDFFADQDPELRRLAIQAVKEQRSKLRRQRRPDRGET
jgi:hypothetical protein